MRPCPSNRKLADPHRRRKKTGAREASSQHGHRFDNGGEVVEAGGDGGPLLPTFPPRRVFIRARP